MIPGSGKLSDKERILLRLAKRQSRARQALDEIQAKNNVHLDFEMCVDKTNLEKTIGGEGRNNDFKKILTYNGE